MPQHTSPPFKVRSTFPGRLTSIREWTSEEINLIISTYRKNFTNEWQSYLDSENDNGFISNQMNDHICSVIEELFPGLHRKHYKAAAVDFRFTNERAFGFTLWQPESRVQRRERRLAYTKQTPQLRNGNVEWTKDQVKETINYIQRADRELWVEYCDVNNNIGFIGLEIIHRILRRTTEIFPLPEDCSLRGILSGLLVEANQVYKFKMLEPENAQARDQLETEWFNERRGYMTFAEWCQQVKMRSKSM
ncbi:hypothetical protein FJ420_32395 [Mesorhizobium sp. B3-1-3]|uniref:hypothetical protein n=1 Tax=unclassified Mesorhizobium TaxID=325217 RepID=UPI0011277E17|nr:MULTISPECIES: hypothetical protein [unclassified Mesorhizobium]TPI52294.1 hypothetical protein FJ424_32825 [Mesorhizobium sp. B3-1-8]TPI59579.1 hypothetical protein FJ420_32395 [Mesorhizobium sp. B3-1-3]